VNMMHGENECTEYDIFIIWNFPQGLGLKVKIGSYLPCFPQSQQLHISDDLEWAMGGTSVGIPQFLFFSGYVDFKI
jgi:vomeronasal 2 receptor